MCIAEFFSIIKDIALAGAALVTAFVAYTGLEKWKMELQGKASFDAAREVIKATYKLRDELSYCRSPFIPAAEFPEGYRRPLGDCTPEERGQAYSHVYTNRWGPVVSAVQDFDAAILEAEALWGMDIKAKADELRQCVRYLRVDIEAFISNEFSDGEYFDDRNFSKKVRSSVSDMKPEDNELTQRINAAIKGLEDEIRPHLSRG
jgi:hypothetical protein